MILINIETRALEGIEPGPTWKSKHLDHLEYIFTNLRRAKLSLTCPGELL